MKGQKLNNKDISIKRLSKQDILLTKQLILLFRTVFEMKKAKTPGKSYLKELLRKPNFVAYIALYKNTVIGGLTAYELPMVYSEGSEMFIYDIAVKHEFQRNGIGKKLILALQKYCKQHRIKEIFVAANEEDTHALEFYRSAKGKAESVVHFTIN
jgi:aminoglycoside 3-N-acetyltransferase I